MLGTGGFESLISAPQSTEIFNPYARHNSNLDYKKWLITMTDRAWRKTRTPGSSAREFYPTDGPDATDFVLPSIVQVF